MPDSLAETAELDALREIPQDLARRLRVLPLAIEAPARGPRVLKVAMADPSDRDAVNELEVFTGCRVEAVPASLAALDEAIARAYRGIVTKVMRPATGEDADDAPLALRLRALLAVLQAKGLLSLDEYHAEIRRLLRERE